MIIHDSETCVLKIEHRFNLLKYSRNQISEAQWNRILSQYIKNVKRKRKCELLRHARRLSCLKIARYIFRLERFRSRFVYPSLRESRKQGRGECLTISRCSARNSGDNKAKARHSKASRRAASVMAQLTRYRFAPRARKKKTKRKREKTRQWFRVWVRPIPRGTTCWPVVHKTRYYTSEFARKRRQMRD